MNMITKLATRLLATLSIVAMLSIPAAAQGLNTSDMALAFGQAPQTARSMSAAEMDETEGAVAPIVIRAVVMGGIGAVVNAANARNNGATTRQIIRSAAIGFAGGAIGGVVSKKLK